MTHTLTYYLCSEKMPEPYTTVIVCGGVAEWTGERWRDDEGWAVNRPIKWWAPLIRDKDLGL